MLRPVRITPPAELPVTLAEAKAHLRVDAADEDELISALIGAATDHLDGWTGILGRALVTQTWRQDFDCFAPCLRLPLSPVSAVTAVSYTDPDGNAQTFADYDLVTDGFGPFVRRKRNASWPTTNGDPVSVTFTAGYGASFDVPSAIKQAILLHIGTLYEYRETMADRAQPTPAYDALIAPYRLLR